MTIPTRLSVLMLVLAATPVAGAEPNASAMELVTAPGAVLCLDADSLTRASGGHVVKHPAASQEQLREIGCLRSPAGIPATRVDAAETGGAWNVRFRPQGMSSGVKLWGRPSAFTLPDGTPLRSLRAAN